MRGPKDYATGVEARDKDRQQEPWSLSVLGRILMPRNAGRGRHMSEIVATTATLAAIAVLPWRALVRSLMSQQPAQGRLRVRIVAASRKERSRMSLGTAGSHVSWGAAPRRSLKGFDRAKAPSQRLRKV